MPTRVLLFEYAPNGVPSLQHLLRELGAGVTLAGEPDDPVAAAAAVEPDVFIADGGDDCHRGVALAARLQQGRPDLPVIVVAGENDFPTAVDAMRAGASDILVRPVRRAEIQSAIQRAQRLHDLRRRLRQLRENTDLNAPAGLIGESAALRAVTDTLPRIGASSATVLITGESGTGKELVAQAIHQESERRDQPFVALNCGAIPAELVESELFGHVGGAFTGASGGGRLGLFVEAGHGTLFLDEVGELPADVQAKLLRVLQERRVRPVGADEEREVAARVICATNRDLEKDVGAGRFRRDLLYRINVVRVVVPPLRDRREDILLLAHHFFARSVRKNHKAVRGISLDAARRLLYYDWPGNVRELENCIERAVAMASFNELTVADLPRQLQVEARTHSPVPVPEQLEAITLAELRLRYVRRVFTACGSDREHTARVLGIGLIALDASLAELREYPDSLWPDTDEVLPVT